MIDREKAKFDAGFDFARRLADRGFRTLLKTNGWQQGGHVIMADLEDPVVEVVAKMIVHDTDDRAFIAVRDDNQEHGFLILIVEKSKPQTWRDWLRGKHAPERIHLDRNANLGMLIEALKPCGTYMPSEWTTELLFEKA